MKLGAGLPTGLLLFLKLRVCRLDSWGEVVDSVVAVVRIILLESLPLFVT